MGMREEVVGGDVKLSRTRRGEATGTGAALRIEREPVQITGRYRGLVKFLGPVTNRPGGFC